MEYFKFMTYICHIEANTLGDLNSKHLLLCMCLFLSFLFLSLVLRRRFWLFRRSYKYSAQPEAYKSPGTIYLSKMSVLMLYTVIVGDCVGPLR